MTQRLGQIEELFHQASELPDDADAETWIEERCASAEIRREVLSLLNARAMRVDNEERLREEGQRVPTSRFGVYAAITPIGQGGVSTVYRACRADGQFEHVVALKVLAPSFLVPTFLRRFDRERQLLASLSHHNIARLLDGGVSSDGEPYLVTELVEGSAIDQYADEHALTVRARLGLFLQVCSAVDYAHRQLVVHGDLKPGNILVNRDGVVKLLDFGTAVLTSPDAHLTAKSERMLTPRYASPEQFRGERLTVASDTYSLGVLAFELLTGASPFGEVDSLASGLNRALGHAAMVAPANAVLPEAALLRSTTTDHLRRTLAGDLTAILRKALEDAPDARYPSVAALAEDITRYLSGRPVGARGSSLTYRTKRFMQRHRLRLVLAGAGVFALSVVGLYGVIEYTRAQRGLVQTRELSAAFLTDIYREVSSLPGSTRARLMIVERAQRNLDEVLADNPGDSMLRTALAQAYIQLADTQGEPFAISLGDSAAALVSYQKAEALALANPDGLDRLALLVRARQGVAEVLIRAGTYQEAARIAQSAIEPARRLWEDAPAGFQVAGRPTGQVYVRVHVLLGHALMRAADVTRDVDGVKQALQQFERAVSVAEDVRRRDPSVGDLAGRYSQYVGYALGLLGDFTGDAAYYDRACVAHQRAADSTADTYSVEPSSINMRNLADSLMELGWSQHLCGKETLALATATRALALIQGVAAEHPDSRETNLEVATAYFRLGAIDGAGGRTVDALAHLTKAASLVVMPEHLTATDRELVVLAANIHEHLAIALQQANRSTAAVTALETAVRVVSDGSFVPAWRVEELRAKLASARTDAFPDRHPPQ